MCYSSYLFLYHRIHIACTLIELFVELPYVIGNAKHSHSYRVARLQIYKLTMSRLVDYSKCRAATEAVASEDLEQSLTSFHAMGEGETARHSRRRSSGSHVGRRTSMSGSNHDRLPAAVFYDSFSSLSTTPINNNIPTRNSCSSILQAKLQARLSGAASPVDVTSSFGRIQMQAGSCYSPPLSPVTNPKAKVRPNPRNKNLNRRSSGVASPPISPAVRRATLKVKGRQKRRPSTNNRNPLHSIYQQQQTNGRMPSVTVCSKPKAQKVNTKSKRREQTTSNTIGNSMESNIITWNRGNQSAFAVVLDSPEIIEVQLAEMPGHEEVMVPETTLVAEPTLERGRSQNEDASSASNSRNTSQHDQRCLSPAYQRRQKMTWLANQTSKPQLLHKNSALSANSGGPPIPVVKIITKAKPMERNIPTPTTTFQCKFEEKVPVPPGTEYASPPLSRHSSFHSSSSSSSSSSEASSYSSVYGSVGHISLNDLDDDSSSGSGSRLLDHQSWSLRALVDTSRSPQPVVNTRRSSTSFVTGSQIRTITLPF